MKKQPITTDLFNKIKSIFLTKFYTVSLDMVDFKFIQKGFDFYDNSNLAIYGDLEVRAINEDTLNIQVDNLSVTIEDGLLELELNNNQIKELTVILETEEKYTI